MKDFHEKSTKYLFVEKLHKTYYNDTNNRQAKTGVLYMNKKQILCSGLSLALLLSTSAVTTPASVSAGKYFTIQYTHSKKKVKKKAINARYNNQIISSKIPGYIEGSTSMYSAYWVFGHCTSLGTKYSYSSSKKRITLQRNSKKLVMTLNKKTATLNGKKFTLPSAPRKIRYVAKKKNYIMVPGNVVAIKLGLNYSWNNRLLSGVLSKGSSTPSTPASPSNTNTNPQPSNPSGSTTKLIASESDYSIRIKKPNGLSSAAISSNDDYWNKQLQIIIDGDYRDFFNDPSNRTIQDSLTYKVSYSGGKTYINLVTSSIKGFSVTQTDSYIYVKYAAPKNMYNRIIVIDAGHGGKDSGATGNGYVEKNMTLKIVQNMKSYFDSDPSYKVYYTRLSDWYPTLTQRYDLANNVNADRFLSVHINSADSSSAKGTETLYKDYKTYAGIIHASSLSGMGYTKGSSYDRDLVYRPGLAVLRGTKMMSALAEMGFISNSTESARIDSRSQTIGSALYQAICNSFN